MTLEIVCAIGMIFAIQTRYVASLEAVFLFVAAWAVWRHSGKMAVADRRLRVLPVLGDLLRRRCHARLICFHYRPA